MTFPPILRVACPAGLSRSCKTLGVESTFYALVNHSECVQLAAMAKPVARASCTAHGVSISQWLAPSGEEVLPRSRVVHGELLCGRGSVLRHLRFHRLSQTRQSALTMSKPPGPGGSSDCAPPIVRNGQPTLFLALVWPQSTKCGLTPNPSVERTRTDRLLQALISFLAFRALPVRAAHLKR